MKTVVASAWCALVLGQAMMFVEAQAPQTLSGRTIELTVTSGTGPFASSGKFRFLPSATDDQYAIVPVYGNIVASTGTYQYRKTGTTTAELEIWDSFVGGTITGTCSFSTGSSGSFTLSLGAYKQTGTFRLYAGQSPSSIAGSQVIVDITSGEYPFGEYGKFKFLPLADNTYQVEPVLGDVVPSHGTYTYQKNSDFTGLIQFNDSVTVQGYSVQLSFDTATTGTLYLRDVDRTGYQTGIFTIEPGDVQGPIVSVTSHKTGETVTTSTINLRGTASDGGRGDNGVRSVTVNGQRASNDTATGSSTANWSKSVTLNRGENTITVVARDSSASQNETTVRITLYYSSSDGVGPTLAVTSHSNGQAITTDSIILRGTASDSGRGNNGIESVTVNGQRASNDTATGSGTANWSKSVNLSPGSNTITVVARDNSPAHNATTSILTLTYVPPDAQPPILAVTSHSDGQTVTTKTITITGTATDAGRGNNGIGSVTVNGQRADNDSVAGSNIANWRKKVSLNLGANILTIVCRDNSAAANETRFSLTIHLVPPTPAASATDFVFVEDSTPTAGFSSSQGTWEWIDRSPSPISGRLTLRVKQGLGLRNWHFEDASSPLRVETGDSLVGYVYLNPAAMPRMIMMQFREGLSWEHRAYWGQDLFPTEWTKGTRTSKVRMGDLPPAGQWVRLEVSARALGLEGKDITGISLDVYDGEVAWDHIGKLMPAMDRIWIGDDVPENAVVSAFWATPWVWADADPVPYRGTRMHVSAPSAEPTTHFASVPWPGWQVNANDSLFAYVYLDPASPPKMIMLQWWDGSWEHRAFWGEDLFPNSWTKGERTSKIRIGPLPEPGYWVRLSVPAAIVGLNNRAVMGIAFTVSGGRVYWDNAGDSVPAVDFVWVGDSLPSGAVGQSYTGEQWTWCETDPVPFSGTKAHVSPPATGLRGHFFANATHAMQVNRGDVLIVHVYLEPTNVPKMIMLQWNDGGSSNPWGHRAYWGENLFSYGAEGPPERCYMGPMPAPGKWTRLEVPARLVGLEGKVVRGMSFDRYGGHVVWDHAGKCSSPLENDVVWLANSLPAGARTEGFSEPPWSWTTERPSALLGETTHKSPTSTQKQSPQPYHQHSFITSTLFPVVSGDKLYSYVYLDPLNMPQMVMVQWNDGLWSHRAYWGENKFPWGKDVVPERCHLGPLPPLGQWVRLEVPASLLALENRSVRGMAFTLYGGQAWWGHAGKTSGSKKPTLPSNEWVWVDDRVPSGSTPIASTGDEWFWTSEEPGPLSGTLTHKSKWAPPRTVRSHYFAWYSSPPTQPMDVGVGDYLICYVYFDPCTPPQMVMLQWRVGSSWEHRAYWGEDLFDYGRGESSSKVSMGMLPPAGRWVRLEVPASKVGLEGQTVNGMAFTLAGGVAYWDRAGKVRGSSIGRSEFSGTEHGGEAGHDSSGSQIVLHGPAQSVQASEFTAGGFHGRLNGVPGLTYRVEASTNLADWVPIAEVQAGGEGVVEFYDREISQYQLRFYRLTPR